MKETVIDDSGLRDKARRVIESGEMPNRYPDRLWGGAGTGIDCAVCGSPTRPDEVEFEIEFFRDSTARDAFYVHGRCLAAWDVERRRVATPEATALP